MRRTYRSKKDTGGGVDHRDMIHLVDSKRSIFDAYYIQNIKQVKREMSCVSASNPYTTASSKVRKRKYVKRLKEPEPVRESLSESAYLTPDKSIRVNRTPDLFDQLLNSPTSAVSPKTTSASANNVHSSAQTRTAKRTYCRKKLAKTKKYDHSTSDDTDSDKENSMSDESYSKNTSNVKAHKLIIEKEKAFSPVHFDDSINKIAEIYPALNKLTKQSTKSSLDESGRFSNILINVTQSPLLPTSPQCSTPFLEKYRGKSIFKFSPIKTNFMEVSSNSIDKSIDNNSVSSIVENNCNDISENNSVKNLTNTETYSEFTQENVKAKDNLLLEKENIGDFQVSTNKNKYSINNTDQLLSNEPTSLSTTELEPFLGFSGYCPIQNSESNYTSNVDEDIPDPQVPSVQSTKSKSSTQSHNETNIHVEDLKDNKELSDSESADNVNSSMESKSSTQSHNETNIHVEDLKDNKELSDSESADNVNSSMESRSSTQSHDETNIHDGDLKNNSTSSGSESIDNVNCSMESRNSTECHNETNIHVEDFENNMAKSGSESVDNVNSSKESRSSTLSHNDTNVHVDDLKNNTSSSGSEFGENESLYDTCDSENMSDYSSQEVKPKVLTVAVERLNDSIFQKYYKRIVDSSLNNENTSSISNTICDDNSDMISNTNESDYESFKDLEFQFQDDASSSSNTSNNNICNNNDQLNSENVELIDVQIISSSENENSDSNDIEEEDTSVSFVTTRRRNDVTNDSFIFNMDNSCASSPSLDKTVLSCNKEKFDETELIDNTLVNDSADENINNDITETDDQIESGMQVLSKEDVPEPVPEPLALIGVSDEEVTNINTRKSSKLFRDSIHRMSLSNASETSSGLRQGIVLKPGKKWERSLSIYRRMTTMGDTFNQTILDDECLKSKGRKYRQSVISTMEMQEYQGSLHNESVFSRRSTFVSKPRRSTIKIFKDSNASGISLSSSILYDDLEGFLNGDCDDTIIELSKLSISDSGHEVTVLDKFHDTSNRIVTARDFVLRRCNQTEPVLFDECYPETVLKNCRKIGEGVYGEVFLWRAGDGRARVMKIVPIAGSTKVNGEEQKDFHQIISEIVIAMELSALRAPIQELERQLDDGKEIDALDLQSVQNATDVFNEVLAIRCVYGAYPSRLLDLWELYDECKGSENDNPAELPSDQQYIVLELANAGQDLESYQFNNAEQAYALFKQIALGLAVAEEALQFEHRDLHWGNVLIAPTDQKYATFVIRGRLHRAARCGVAATLIDYSLSRAARDGAALYNDLADDDALFDAVGDYQFEVYRLMRDKLGNDWKNFEPYTNILWLHYTVDKMITALRYTRTNTKIHKHYIAKLKEIKNRVLDYGSATQFILTDNEF